MTQNTTTLEREKRYETDVHSDCEFGGLPNKVRFVLTEADAREIIKFSALVAANGLYQVEKFDNRTSWLKVDDPDDDETDFSEVNTEVGTLIVSENEFWFSSYLKHTGVLVRSDQQTIQELKEWLGIQDVSKQAAATAASEPRVLVVVSGGVADPVCDAGVDVEVFDWDNYNADPEGTGGVPSHFADLAEGRGIPVREAEPKSQMPRPTGG